MAGCQQKLSGTMPQRAGAAWTGSASTHGGGPDVSNLYAVLLCEGDGQPGCAFGDIRPVGSRFPPLGKGASKWGHADLAGNVAEWTMDCYSDGYQAVKVCMNCANLALKTPLQRVVRGGDFAYNAYKITTSIRYSIDPDRQHTVGARCARKP